MLNQNCLLASWKALETPSSSHLSDLRTGEYLTTFWKWQSDIRGHFMQWLVRYVEVYSLPHSFFHYLCTFHVSKSAALRMPFRRDFLNICAVILIIKISPSLWPPAIHPASDWLEQLCTNTSHFWCDWTAKLYCMNCFFSSITWPLLF